MKKILLILLLFLPITIFAKEITNYEIIKEYGPYQKNPSEEYPYLSDQFIWQEVTKLKERPNEEPNREIFTETYYASYPPAKIKRIAITNIHLYNTNYLPLTEIEVYVKDKKMNYHVICTSCGAIEVDQFQDNDHETVIGDLTTQSIVDITLDEPVLREELTVKLHFQKNVEKNFFYALLWMENTEYSLSNLGYSPDILYIRFMEKIEDKSISEKSHQYTKENLSYVRYEKEISYTKELPNEENQRIGEEILYGYREKWYQSYRLKTIEHSQKEENSKQQIIQKFPIETSYSNFNDQTRIIAENKFQKKLMISPKVESSTILLLKKERKKTRNLEFRQLSFLIILIVLFIFYLVWRLLKRSR